MVEIAGSNPAGTTAAKSVVRGHAKRQRCRASQRAMPLLIAEWTGVWFPARSHKPFDAGSNPASATFTSPLAAQRSRGILRTPSRRRQHGLLVQPGTTRGLHPRNRGSTPRRSTCLIRSSWSVVRRLRHVETIAAYRVRDSLRRTKDHGQGFFHLDDNPSWHLHLPQTIMIMMDCAVRELGLSAFSG
jgi:hypothetical protein